MISVVIPVYNNQDSLGNLSKQLQKELQTEEHEVIFINDGSYDNSEQLLNDLSLQSEKLKVIHFSKNFGQHPALSAGFDKAKGDIIVMMDADLQDDPKYISELIANIRDGNDFCFTIKNEKFRFNLLTILSWLYHKVIGLLLKSPTPPAIGTYRAFNKKILQALKNHPEYNILFGPLMHHMGYTRKYIDVDRAHSSVSSYTFGKRLNLALNSLISYSDLPHKLFFWVGLTLLSLTMFYGLASLVGYFIFNIRLMTGLTLLLMISLIMMSTLMIGLGIIGAYVFKVYQEVLSRPRYLIREERNF